MQIKYLDLQAQYHSIKPEIDAAIQNVLESSTFVLGPSVAEFEKNFAAYCETGFCAGVNSGTSAVLLALRALGIGPGDEVVTTANTFVATIAAIAYTGARPVLVDADPNTRNIDPELISMAISPKTRAIMPVHLYGRIADMEPILRVAANHGLPVVEDSAQAHGARYKGKRAGSIGTIAAFSFYPGKNLGAYGEGGAVTTSDPKLDKAVRVLRDHGSEKKYHYDMIGYNARLEGMQGAILNVKLRHLDKWNQERRRVGLSYNKHLQGVPVKTPGVHQDHDQVYHVYVIETPRRDELHKYLADHGVPTIMHYPVPVHVQKAFDHLGYREGDFPVTEKLCREVLSLPIYPEMNEEQIAFVAATIKNFFNG
jgi:dTDP-4-amino-4,6-dideoxygalactose transaminase